MKNITLLFMAVLLLVSTFPCRAAAPLVSSVATDSIADLRPLTSWQRFNRKVDKFTSSKGFQMTYVGVPLVVAGVATIPGRERFRQLRNDYVPEFKYKYDDYLQYAPAVVMLGLKGFGVESRSSWGRMLVSDVFSAAIMATVVNSIKYTAHVQRPDGSNYKSFPSGHTATAFMTAMMMHKEYGDRSPWYSISAFTVAAVTGVSRQLNNRHWVSDVLAGAGIGILSTELGYYLADLIFKDKGLNFESPTDYPLLEKPSFVGLYMGFSSGLGSIALADGMKLNTGIGSRIGVEGAYFFNRYIGCGGMATVSNIPVSLNTRPDAALEPIDEGRAMAGAYAQYPCTSRWSVGCKALAGYNYIPSRTLGCEGITFGRDNFVWSAGVSIGYMLKSHFGARFFCDYTSTSTSFTLLPSQELGISEARSGNSTIHTLTWGASANILF